MALDVCQVLYSASDTLFLPVAIWTLRSMFFKLLPCLSGELGQILVATQLKVLGELF